MQVRAVTTIRVGKRKKFTTVSRSTVNDGRLSFRARGILVWLLDKPDDWRTTADGIATAGVEGRDAVRSALTELEACGYLERRRWRTGTGAWQSEWTVHECPNAAKAGNQRWLAAAENQALLPSTEPNTDLAEHVSVAHKADPRCVTCRGKGEHYDGMAGFDRVCACTRRERENHD